MSDQLLLDNYLLVLKSTVEVFVHGTLESSNNDVRKILKNGLDEIMECQANTYNEMTNQGWYQADNVKENEICKTLKKLESSD